MFFLPHGPATQHILTFLLLHELHTLLPQGLLDDADAAVLNQTIPVFTNIYRHSLTVLTQDSLDKVNTYLVLSIYLDV